MTGGWGACEREGSRDCGNDTVMDLHDEGRWLAPRHREKDSPSWGWAGRVHAWGPSATGVGSKAPTTIISCQKGVHRESQTAKEGIARLIGITSKLTCKPHESSPTTDVPP